jgi:hypothetical protein
MSSQSNFTDLTSSLPLAIAAADDATIDLTTPSVCVSTWEIVMTAGWAKTTAYKNPKPNMTIMSTAKQTTRTNQNGTVNVTFENRPKLDDSFASCWGSGRSGAINSSTSMVLIAESSLEMRRETCCGRILL